MSVLFLERPDGSPHVVVLDGDLYRGLAAGVEVRIVVLGADRRVRAAAQQVLVNLEVPVVLRQVRCSVERGEAAVVGLVHRLRAVVDDVVDHVELLVGGAEVDRPAGAVVLGPVVRVGVHDELGLLGVREAEAGVEGEGLELGLRRVPPGLCERRRRDEGARGVRCVMLNDARAVTVARRGRDGRGERGTCVVASGGQIEIPSGTTREDGATRRGIAAGRAHSRVISRGMATIGRRVATVAAGVRVRRRGRH